MVVESANATHLLNLAATAEGIVSKFPQHFQRQFAELALRQGYDMEVVLSDLFVEFVDQSQQLASSRLGRLMKTSKDRISPCGTGWSKLKSPQAHVAQMDVISKVSDQRSPKETAKDFQSLRKCAACRATDHSIWRCQGFVKDSLNAQRTLVKQKHLCFNCLGIGHSVKDCSSKVHCHTCAKMHHSLLHPPSNQLSPCSEPQKQVKTREDVSHTTTPLSMPTSTSTDTPHVANISQVKGARNGLQVLLVSIVNPSTGIAKNSWALLDTGVDTHLLSCCLYSELGFEGKPVWSRLQLPNGDLKTFHTHKTSCVVQDVDGNWKECK